MRGHSNVQGIGTIGVKPVLAEDVIQALESELGIELPESAGMDTLACLDAACKGKIDAALIMGGNLYGASPDSLWAQKALDHIDFKLFLTTTLNTGHVHGMENSEALILPVSARDEEWQPTTQESMFNYVRLSDGGIERLDNVKPEVEILASMAEKMGLDSVLDFSAFKQHRHIRQVIARCIPGMANLKDIDIAKQEFHVKGRLLHTPDFKTPNGRANFVTHTLSKERLPSNVFSLTTVRSEGQFNTIIYEQKDSYRQVNDRWSLLMNVDDMDKLGVEEGGLITLTSETGTMENLKAKAFPIPVGNLMAYYPEANVLVGREVDPRSKTPAFKNVEVSARVSRVG